ncbi:OmpH family outer membrane protein [Ignatzschineria rhizosphaerae]|uniref:OmpH family outer membrane protein n=1 Tax=Ignatzschineria rhizosphaerae TaxID=2923279 RepID=A0ABY3WX34_9GAMM|nr:OmpH family outer membrane protein [Ignatzschineria rhizosphaerae]UNM95168.1 OmpH family outer membrane protein [Ignatzschineria rhizosphaerae]
MFNHLFKKGAAVILTAALLVFTPSAFAKELKIGVVDINLLLEKYIEEKDIYSLLNEEFFARDQYLLKKRDQIESLRRELMSSSGDEAASIREIERNIVNLEREFVRISNDTRQEFNLRKNEELYKLQREINTAILQYAQDYDYDLILESGLLFAKEALYLTDPIFQTLVQDNEE